MGSRASIGGMISPSTRAGRSPRESKESTAVRGAVYPPAMYESVRGRLLEKDPSRCVVEAGGFGWAISIPLSTFERLPRLGEEASLRLHLVQPERGGDWRLFGFASEDERALFRACLRVAGVGPATAIALLSGMATAALEA